MAEKNVNTDGPYDDWFSIFQFLTSLSFTETAENILTCVSTINGGFKVHLAPICLATLFTKQNTKSKTAASVLAFLVIYHEIRDFELDPRDKNFCSVTSHEPLKVRDFGKFPKKLGKSSNFAQKVIISVTKNQK